MLTLIHARDRLKLFQPKPRFETLQGRLKHFADAFQLSPLEYLSRVEIVKFKKSENYISQKQKRDAIRNEVTPLHYLRDGLPRGKRFFNKRQKIINAIYMFSNK